MTPKHHRMIERRGGRRGWAPGLLVVLALMAAARDGAADPYFLFDTLSTDSPLASGNASKVVVGLFNRLHAVYVSGGTVYYTASSNGAEWDTPVPISTTAASDPAIAVDSAGKVGVVWVHFGSLYYSYHLPGDPDWTFTSLGLSGAEPALAAGAGTMHLTWSAGQRLRYTTFPPDAPTPLPPEAVDTTTCGGQFRKPSIVLTASASPSCPPSDVTIAYLAQGVAPGCVNSVGARVRRRASPGSWPLLYSNVPSTSSMIASSLVSLSLGANRATGDLFLAWSDKLSGTARTVLARGKNTLWASVPMSATARHVHVRAASSLAAPATQFRLAWTEAGSGGDPFYGPATYLGTATWAAFVPESLTWTDTTLLSTIGAGRPQAVFWRRCLTSTPSPVFAETRAYFEATAASGGGRTIATSYLTSAGCPAVTIGSGTACAGPAIPVAGVTLPGLTTPGTVVDLGEVGAITRLSPGAATVTTPDGRAVTVTWRTGEVVASSDTTLTLSAPRADVAVSSADVAFTLVELGQLRDGGVVP